jgi:hypothetical protein
VPLEPDDPLEPEVPLDPDVPRVPLVPLDPEVPVFPLVPLVPFVPKKVPAAATISQFGFMSGADPPAKIVVVAIYDDPL